VAKSREILVKWRDFLSLKEGMIKCDHAEAQLEMSSLDRMTLNF
jgi:hypothetical protein